MKDNHCPIADVLTSAYSINIVAPYTLSDSQISATQCVHQAAVNYYLSGGILPRTITVSQGPNIVKTLTDTTGFLTDSLPAGTYIVTVSSPYLNCSATNSITIVDSGTLPSPAYTSLSFCINDSIVAIDYPAFSGASLHWYNANESILAQAPQ